MTIVKSGYPPRQLTLIPELPVSSLGLRAGDQIILTQKPGTAPSPASSTPLSSQAAPPPSTPLSAGAPRSAGLRESYLAIPTTPSGGTDYVNTDSGVLIHRVRAYLYASSPGIYVARLHRLCRMTTRVCSVADRKSTRLNSSHSGESRMPSSA